MATELTGLMWRADSTSSETSEQGVSQAYVFNRVRSFDHGYRAVILAVIAVGVVQVAIDQVIDMVAMRHRFMPATRAADMVGSMAATF